MERILVAYDGSEQSRHALDRAAELASRLSASLTILVVGELIESGYGTVVPVVETEVFENLVEEGVTAARERGVPAEGRLEWGTPGDRIVRTAESEGFDLIVVGHRGRGGLASLFLGSVAKHVIDHARGSVLVVR